MSNTSEREFEKIGEAATEKADRVDCTLRECLEGLKDIQSTIQDRIDGITEELGEEG